MEEEFRDIPGYEGLYKISNTQKVLRLADPTLRGKNKDKFIQPFYRNDGYLMIKLFKKGKCKSWLFHRLMGIVFIPNPDNKPCINHENGLRDDCRIENLNWVTVSENHLHKYRVLKSINPGAKAVYQYNRDKGLINIWDSITMAAKTLKFRNNLISKAANGINSEAYGFIWSFKELELVCV